MLVAIGSANRDETRVEDGATFDIRRPNAHKHKAFCFGRRLCLSADLARVEMRAIIGELARRLPHTELAAAPNYSYSPNNSDRGPERVGTQPDTARSPEVGHSGEAA